jgi:hypothetical protein
VFFVTGRPDRFDLRFATVKNLKQTGYDGWQDLIMRPIASAGSVSEYKPPHEGPSKIKDIK